MIIWDSFQIMTIITLIFYFLILDTYPPFVFVYDGQMQTASNDLLANAAVLQVAIQFCLELFA